MAQEQRREPDRHGGAWQGFKTHYALFHHNKLSVVVLANLQQADPARIVDAIASASPTASVSSPGSLPSRPVAVMAPWPGVRYVISAVRTPVGRYGGALAGVRPDDLAAIAVAVAEYRLSPSAMRAEDSESHPASPGRARSG